MLLALVAVFVLALRGAAPLGVGGLGQLAQFDLSRLEQWIEETERAAKVEPSGGPLDPKALVSLGNAYVLKAQMGSPEYFARARSAFEPIVERFEGGDRQVAALASHAYLGLGIVSERADRDYAQAASFYRKSLASASGNQPLSRLAAEYLESIEQRHGLPGPDPEPP